jgi:hypothetical protein
MRGMRRPKPAPARPASLEDRKAGDELIQALGPEDEE